MGYQNDMSVKGIQGRQIFKVDPVNLYEHTINVQRNMLNDPDRKLAATGFANTWGNYEGINMFGESGTGFLGGNYDLEGNPIARGQRLNLIS